MLLPGCFSVCCVPPPPADFEHVCWVLVIGVLTGDRLQPKAPELPKPKGLPFRGWMVVADGRGGFKWRNSTVDVGKFMKKGFQKKW